MKPNPRGKISTKTWLMTRKSRFCIKTARKKLWGTCLGESKLGKQWTYFVFGTLECSNNVVQAEKSLVEFEAEEDEMFLISSWKIFLLVLSKVSRVLKEAKIKVVLFRFALKLMIRLTVLVFGIQ